MKYATLAALVATASAQEGFNCVNPTEDAWTTEAVTEGVTDAATCETKGTEAIEATADYKTFDWCLHAAVQAEVAAKDAVEADESADPPVEAADAVEAVAASVTCAWFQKATVADADIRKAAATENGLTYSAWAWGAGEALEDLVAAEGDADSAKMITSALAAVATIAMVAY